MVRPHIIACALLFVLTDFVVANQSLEQCFQQFPLLADHYDIEIVATSTEWQYIVECSGSHSLNLLQAISFFIPILRNNNMKLIVSGDVVDEVATRYDYGYLVNDLMIPVGHINRINIGFVDDKSFSKSSNIALEIFLNSLPPPNIQLVRFIGKTEIQVQYHYGFKTISPNNLVGGFGVITSALNRDVEIDRMEFYKANHVAIYTGNFWIPKRKTLGFPFKK